MEIVYRKYRLTYLSVKRLLSSLNSNNLSVFSGVNTSLEQTSGICLNCGINEIATIHLECGHFHCCEQCSIKCRLCRAPDCTQTHPNHVRIYPGKQMISIFFVSQSKD